MLRRRNADVKQFLLAGSDPSGSDADSSSNSSDTDFEFSSADERPKLKSKKPIEDEKAAKPSSVADASSDVEDKAEVEEEKPEVALPSALPTDEDPSKQVADENFKVEPESKFDGGDQVNHEPQTKKARQRRDTDEREIFSKSLLTNEGDGKSVTSSGSVIKTESPRKPKREIVETVEIDDKPIDATIDVSMFENKKTYKEVDLQKLFDRRAVNDGAGPSTSAQPSKPPPAMNEDEWISLSSDSDSEVSVVPAGSTARIPKRKKMLTEEELQEETKRAQKEETQRVDRLKKKTEVMTQMLSQRLSQSSESQHELVLDYDPKRKITIAVHPKLVKLLKDHQKEGIKFM